MPFGQLYSACNVSFFLYQIPSEFQVKNTETESCVLFDPSKKKKCLQLISLTTHKAVSDEADNIWRKSYIAKFAFNINYPTSYPARAVRFPECLGHFKNMERGQQVKDKVSKGQRKSLLEKLYKKVKILMISKEKQGKGQSVNITLISRTK